MAAKGSLRSRRTSRGYFAKVQRSPPLRFALCMQGAWLKGLRKRSARNLGRRFRRMLVANGCHSADLFHATKHMGGNIGTAGVVAQIFC